MSDIKVHIADDHAIVVDGLEMLVDAMHGFTVLHTSNNGEEALEKINNDPVDLLIADIDMPVMNGIDLIKSIRRSDQRIIAICLSAFNDSEVIAKAFAAGANGYVCKQSLKQDLESCLNEVLQGKAVLKNHKESNALNSGEFLCDSFIKDYQLSEREFEIILEIARTGNKNHTAENLCISPHTIQTHLKRINKKVGVTSLTELIVLVYQSRLL